ncbi:orotate phosphoribosyltransferase [Sphaerochaeta globosa]|jgi:orotate phosphoribosyltransferase|uniref:Orotate phosphoribosyltransferase n=1 Tax=Sphaerochaeta globosa (strain ATCC BAA-1886 / DSM 22777 / Buddy) TaxID=158189 RepID=F0RTV4_SPHGB|nr:orotate phosphoribosyltransferase [Sphaerochaeta globosa]ADY13825.1 orotate phosphoribosyltransferase [Sphaerochaeta globosa str. Buddy]
MKSTTEITNHYGPLLAHVALDLGAIKLQVQQPFTWASGYRMPIYNDNRRLLASPKARSLVCDAFAAMLESLQFEPDNIAGTATAGIPHATTLADRLAKPLSYVRSSGKDHGLGQQIEGLGQSGSYEGAKVLLIEDLISTGGSSIKAVEAIVKAGGVCPYTLAIFTYGFDAAVKAFEALDQKCTFYTILDYDVMVESALKKGYVNEEEAGYLSQWREDPFTWGEKHGFPMVAK